MVVGLSQLLVSPPAGYSPEGQTATTGSAVSDKKDYTWKEMISTDTFWFLWVIFAIGSGAGLMVISFAAPMAKTAFAETAWIAVTVLAIGNASGRLFAGILSDKIGRKASLVVFLVFQAGIIFALMKLPTDSAAAILLAATFIGFNYGTNLTLFPAATKDYFGLKSFGLNYGIVFTAWGVGGAILTRVSKMMNSLEYSCIMAGSLLLLGAVITLFVRAPREKAKNNESLQPASAKS